MPLRALRVSVPGMTLVELLVAFALLIVLSLSLLAMAGTSADHWSRSEARKDAYDRAARVLEAVERDLRCAYIDAQVPVWEGRALPPAVFMADADPPRLRFVRSSAEPAPVDARRGPELIALLFGVFSEVAYVHDPREGTLWRFEQPFDRGGPDSIFGRNWDRRDPGEGPGWTRLQSGVLRVEYRFYEAPGAEPESEWDSTRRAAPRPFVDPDFVMPGLVEVIVEVEAVTTDEAAVRLATAASSGGRRLEMTQTRPLPDPPGFLLIEDEWIAYDEKDSNGVRVTDRGARGTTAAAHDAQAPVRFAERFSLLVHVPLQREGRRR